MDEEILGFRSLLEYTRFVEHIEGEVRDKTFVEIDPGGRWFLHAKTGKIWRLNPPDFPLRGSWKRVEL
jgi:hypothetical protein